MASKKSDELRNLCRICAADIIDETSTHSLIENKLITGLGEKFITCLGLQPLIDGYPQRVCDYCHLQLNTFYAFVQKAKSSSKQFEDIIGKPTRSKRKLTDTVNYTIENTAKSDEKEVLVEYYVENADLTHDAEIILGVELDENEYPVEYLEPEFLIDDSIKQSEDNDNEEPDEIDENDQDDDDDLNKIEDKSYELEKDESDDGKDDEFSNQAKQKRRYPYKCKTCLKRFVYKEVYEAHIRIHKGLPGFECPHCPKTFNEKANFDYHMQDHTNYRPAKCHLCEKSFKNKQDLASHIRCHKDIRKYMCDVCGKRFRSQSHMTYHRYAHFEARNFACDQCPQKFKSPHVLRTHKNTVHSDVYRYECELCGRQFKRDHHLVAHRKTHNKPIKVVRTRKARQTNKPSIEMVQIKEEEMLIDDVVYEEEYISDQMTE